MVKPIVYGSISRHFGKKRESDGHTHEWTVYVKPFHNEDMSAYVRKVQFKLHESYANPNRKVQLCQNKAVRKTLFKVKADILSFFCTTEMIYPVSHPLIPIHSIRGRCGSYIGPESSVWE